MAVPPGWMAAVEDAEADADVDAEADVLVLTDVYPAGEAPIAGADGRALARAVRARGKVDPVLIEHPRELKDTLPTLLRNGDLLLLLGAVALLLRRFGRRRVRQIQT